MNSGPQPELGGRETEITAFYASLDSYVSLAEQLPLAQLPELMNAYLGACSDEISEEQGTIDKYIGDTVVAMFGAPIPVAHHALHACVAALKCQSRVAELRARFEANESKWPPLARQLRVRCGINSGSALIGNTGNRTRFNYTMMGDNVNLAARLEKGAKHWGVWTLCTGTTKRACENAEPGRIVFRSLGPIVVMGRAEPVELFEPMALREDATERIRECIALFEAGLARHRQSDWSGALELFSQSARLERDQPGTSPEIKCNPSLVFIAIAEQRPRTGEIRTAES